MGVVYAFFVSDCLSIEAHQTRYEGYFSRRIEEIEATIMALKFEN